MGAQEQQQQKRVDGEEASGVQCSVIDGGFAEGKQSGGSVGWSMNR